MLHLGILKTWNATTHKAGVQLVDSLTTYLDDIAVATNIPSSAMVVGNYVLVAIPGGNPRDACVVASWPAGSSGGGGGTKIQDADGDTSWDVEQTADEDKVHGTVKNVEAFLLHDDGIVDLAKQSSFRAHRESQQTIPSNAWTKIQFDHEDFDTQSEYDNATNYRFTAKKAGTYLFGGGLEFRGVQANDQCMLMFYKNGSQHQTIWKDYVPADYPLGVGSAVIVLAANDYIELWAWDYNHAFNTGQITASCFFAGIKVA